MADKPGMPSIFGAKQGGGGAKHNIFDPNLDTNLTKIVDDEIKRQQNKSITNQMLGGHPSWFDHLNRTKQNASIPRDMTYVRALDLITRFEARRQEELFMWPGCDKCQIIYPTVIPSPEPGDAGDAVLSAPYLAERTCLHAANHDQPLRFHIPWPMIVLLKDELIAGYQSKVDDVKLVRRPGTKRIR